MQKKSPDAAAKELRNFEVQELEKHHLEAVIGADNCVCGCGSDDNCVCGGCGNGICPIEEPEGNAMCPCMV